MDEAVIFPSEPESTASMALGEAPASRDQVVHLLPSGTFTGRDGRGPYVLADAERVIRSTQRYAGGSQLAIDYDHQAEYARENGNPAPAAGWIKGLQARPDGIWGLVEWTARAAQQLAGREYRYLSPVFNFDPSNGRVSRILRAALTNAPNLELTAIASVGGAMDDVLVALRKALDLPETAAAGDILGKVRALTAAGHSAVDLSQFVPIGELRSVAAELQQHRHATAAQTAEIVVSRAIGDGQLPPSLRSWALALATSDRPAFDQFVAGMPAAFADLGVATVHGARPGAEQLRGRGLDDQQKAICKALGLSADAYIATLKG